MGLVLKSLTSNHRELVEAMGRVKDWGDSYVNIYMDSSIHQAPGLQFGEYFFRFFHVKKKGKNRFAKGTIVRFISGL